MPANTSASSHTEETRVIRVSISAPPQTDRPPSQLSMGERETRPANKEPLPFNEENGTKRPSPGCLL